MSLKVYQTITQFVEEADVVVNKMDAMKVSVQKFPEKFVESVLDIFTRYAALLFLSRGIKLANVLKDRNDSVVYRAVCQLEEIIVECKALLETVPRSTVTDMPSDKHEPDIISADHIINECVAFLYDYVSTIVAKRTKNVFLPEERNRKEYQRMLDRYGMFICLINPVKVTLFMIPRTSWEDTKRHLRDFAGPCTIAYEYALFMSCNSSQFGPTCVLVKGGKR